MKPPWLANKPEQRLSIALDRFLERALVQPAYATAVHDADGGGRTDLQRARDRARGIKPGILDWEVWQAPHGLARRVELKRGKNRPTRAQLATIAALAACGAMPILAWSLRDVHYGLVEAGFRFTADAEAIRHECETDLAEWDAKAAAILAGTVRPKRRRRPTEWKVAREAYLKKLIEAPNLAAEYRNADGDEDMF